MLIGTMARQRTVGPIVEVHFVATPDGLLRDQIILRNTNASAEAELQPVLERLRDPDLDLSFHSGRTAP